MAETASSDTDLMFQFYLPNNILNEWYIKNALIKELAIRLVIIISAKKCSIAMGSIGLIDFLLRKQVAIGM